ncbi:unnamed protein product [Lactuca saligna]|uniref:Uncharacterized protein n=1 Tax=Lactuca saligna TaxID=75948 RepID=A0AA35VDV8_LACSI|nr:unnamed protein product [Lactuca saligna]
MDWIVKITGVIASLLSSHVLESCLSGSPMGSSHHRSASDSLSKPRPPISYLMKCLTRSPFELVHGMLSQMDPVLVSYCEKTTENRGPLTLPEKIGRSVHVAQMETTMTRASSLLRNVQPEVNVDQSYEIIA